MRLDPEALRVVEAVARQGSLTRAAAALGMTQPAISYRLARIEARLGCRLFRRGRPGCAPTAEGAVLLAALLPALAQIDAALAEVAAMGRAPVLRVLTDFGLAGQWLLPRLAGFRARHPGVETQITAAQVVPDPRPGEVAIRFARSAPLGGWLLMPERVVPVASPAWRGDWQGGQGASLLHLEAPPGAGWLTWADWFAAQGVLRGRRAGELQLNTYDLVIQAALAGQGVALGWLPLVAAHLAAGKLVALAPELPGAGTGYWVEGTGPQTPAQRAFAEWLAQEAGQEGPAQAGLVASVAFGRNASQ